MDVPASARDVADADSEALIDLIGGCWAAYPGCVLDVDGEEPWLRAPAGSYERWGGRMWVVPGTEGGLDACVGYLRGEFSMTLKSLYVTAGARRRGLGEALVRLVEDAARSAGLGRVTLWSDTRFADAHRLYERLGYTRGPCTRELHDLSNTTEYEFSRTLG